MNINVDPVILQDEIFCNFSGHRGEDIHMASDLNV